MLYFVLFFFVYVASFSGLSIVDCPFDVLLRLFNKTSKLYSSFFVIVEQMCFLPVVMNQRSRRYIISSLYVSYIIGSNVINLSITETDFHHMVFFLLLQ